MHTLSLMWSPCRLRVPPCRLRVQYESLKQVEQDQLEITEDFGLK